MTSTAYCEGLSPACGARPSTILPTLPLQFSSLKALIGDLRGGLTRVNTEILEAAGCGENSASAHKQFGELMVAFHQTAKQTFLSLEVSVALLLQGVMWRLAWHVCGTGYAAMLATLPGQAACS